MYSFIVLQFLVNSNRAKLNILPLFEMSEDEFVVLSMQLFATKAIGAERLPVV